jgi:hypothetical protein
VTLFGYPVGTVKNCESGQTGSRQAGASEEAVRPFCFELGPRFRGDDGEVWRDDERGGGVPTKREMTLVAKRKPQAQSTKEHSWTKEKESEFISVLSETCNVTRACEAVGMSTTGAYKRRKKNAGFRAAWLETISTAYQRLELVLLDRTFNGTEKIFQRHDGTEDRMREYPNRLGLSLLQMHRATAAELRRPEPAAEDDDIRERLIRKLLRLKQRAER